MVLADFVKGMVACLFTTGGLCAAFYAGNLHGRGLLDKTVSNVLQKTEEFKHSIYDKIGRFWIMCSFTNKLIKYPDVSDIRECKKLLKIIASAGSLGCDTHPIMKVLMLLQILLC